MFSGRNHFLLVILLGLGSVLFFKFSQAQVNYCRQAYDLVQTVEKFHYAPRSIDDNFSADVFDQFIENVDPSGLFFSKEDGEKLKAFRKTIDDQIANQNCDYFQTTKKLYLEKLNIREQELQKLKTKTLDFKTRDSLLLDDQYRTFPESEMFKNWERLIKAQILYTYLSNADSVPILEHPSKEEISQLQAEIIDQYECRIQSRQNPEYGMDHFIGEHFMRALSTAFDPHSNYFGVTEKESYDADLSKESMSFGLEFDLNESGQVEIVYIVPGSVAWNSNKLNEGDVVTKVVSKEGGTVSFDCVSLAEVYDFIDQKENQEVTFHIKKKNGKKSSIKLVKAVLDVEQNVIQSYILEGKKQIGYIYLPSFYSQMDSHLTMPNGCSNDLAKEILKLRRDGIEGLVLDLRNNGGGSMLEAIRLAGVFINFGALGIFDARDVDPETMKDMDRGIVYAGPLLILINKFSASASELFAAAMQDYNRAVVVGSNSFGKSTAQEIFPIDAYKYSSAADYMGDPEAFVKITEGAFFRIDGTTHQKVGVVPDIRLPEIYDRTDMGEGGYKNALEFPAVVKKVYAYPHSPLPIEELKKKSAERVANSKLFQEIERERNLPFEQTNSLMVPLDFKGFKKLWLENEKEEEDKEENLSLFSVKNPDSEIEISEMTESQKEIKAATMKNIETDPYLKESFLIINELIQLLP